MGSGREFELRHAAASGGVPTIVCRALEGSGITQFQACSTPLGYRMVPPTAVTQGSDAGYCTSSAVEPVWAKQPSEPEFPLAAKMVCPWDAACSNKVVYAPREPSERADDSHSPQLVEITCAASDCTIWFQTSYAV